MLKPIMPNFRHDLYARLKNFAEKQVPVKLKPIVGWRQVVNPTLLKINYALFQLF